MKKVVKQSNVPGEYRQQYELNKCELLRLSELSSEWNLLQEKEGVTVHQRSYGDYNVAMSRIEASFNGSVEEVADLLFNNAQELLNSKPGLQSAQTVKEMGEKGRIVLVTTKPMFLISSRQILVYVNHEREGEDGRIQVQVGLESHPDAPVDPQLVQSTTVLGGHILVPDPEDNKRTKVIYIILNLLNGNLPPKLQNMVIFEIITNENNDIITQAVNQHLNGYIYFKKYFEKKCEDDKQQLQK